jgi:hypothetical protein
MTYRAPEVIELGSIEQVTEGQDFSVPDGDSGTTGNRGQGKKGNQGGNSGG